MSTEQSPNQLAENAPTLFQHLAGVAGGEAPSADPDPSAVAPSRSGSVPPPITDDSTRASADLGGRCPECSVRMVSRLRASFTSSHGALALEAYCSVCDRHYRGEVAEVALHPAFVEDGA